MFRGRIVNTETRRNMPENGGKSSKNGFAIRSVRSFRGLGCGVLEVAMVRVVTFSNRFIARAAPPRMSP